MKKLLTPLLWAASIGAFTPAAQAYDLSSNRWCDTGDFIKRTSPNVTLKAWPADFGPGTVYRNSLDNAALVWNRNPSNARFTIETGTHTNWSSANGINEVWGHDNIDLGNATLMRFRGCTLIETDVLALRDYNSSSKWTDSRVKEDLSLYGGSGRSMEAMLIHELGHVIALNHEDTIYSAMGNANEMVVTNGGHVEPHIGADTARGAVILYGKNASTIEDVSVSHWMATGSSNGYSVNNRTGVRDESGNSLVLLSPLTPPENTYWVGPNQSITVDVTFENSGQNLQTFLAYYVLSDDRIIDENDHILAGDYITLSAGGVWTPEKNLQMPSGISYGQKKWLGVVVDPNDELAEVNENNNATYFTEVIFSN